MRLVPLVLAALGMAATALADSPDAKPGPAPDISYRTGQETGTYRFGATYSVRSTGSASDCQAICNGEAACLAWSHVAATGDDAARCELKRGAGRPAPDLLATSGIAAKHEARYLPPEEETDLLGAPESAAEQVAASVPEPPSRKRGPRPLTVPTDD